MSEEEIREAQLQAVRDLKAKGVTGIKLELEGTTQRRNVNGRSSRCTDCSGNGSTECEPCQGLGWMVDSDGYETDDECTSCESTGRQRCQPCGGSGQIMNNDVPNLSTDQAAFAYFMRKLSEKVGQDAVNLGIGNESVNPFPWMSFVRLYYDGSVDTEVTFTVRLDNEENIFYIPKVLEAYKEMADDHQQGLDVRGAGMHTALIFSRGCSYPSTVFPFNREVRNNFKRSVTQLLPALYFLATATGRSRPMNYRPPIIDGQQKGSAISIHDGAIEFRIFDTCYEKPTAALDNIVVIRNVMKFMTEQYTSPGIGDAIKKQAITFGNSVDQTLGRLYITTDQISALYAGLPVIMPEYYTIDQLKEQREFNRELNDAAEIERQQQEQAEMEYAEYEERFNWQLKAREEEVKGQVMRNIIDRATPDDLKKMTKENLEKLCASQIKSEVEYYKSRKEKAAKYIKNRINTLQSGSRGDYEIALA